MKPQTTQNIPRQEQARHQKQGSISTSEEEEGTQNNINNEWQVIRNSTRKRKNTRQYPRERNRNIQPLWYTNKRNKPKLHRRKSKSHTEPQTPTYIHTWGDQLWSNDQPNKKNS